MSGEPIMPCSLQHPVTIGSESNAQMIHEQIRRKNMYVPYVCPSSVFRRVETDINEWPYGRQFRGRIDSTIPIVWGREAGYAAWATSTASFPRPSPSETLTGLCFQIPCSTILPCNPLNPKPLATTDTCVYTSP